jgi:N-acetylmuramoyl-L-alanine amidase
MKLIKAVFPFLLIIAVFVSIFHFTNGAIPTINKAQLPVVRTDRTLILDAGHGGEDGGAVSITGTYESAINLDIVLRAEQLSAFYGIVPVLTRYSDNIEYPSDAATTRARKVADQKARVQLINSSDNAVLISVHQNKYTTSAPSGCQVFYAPTDRSDVFAGHIQELMLSYANAGNRSSAVKIPDSIYLMNAIECPAILVECGFISNDNEAVLLESKEYQIKLATIIIGGFLEFNEQQSDSSDLEA